MSNVVYRTSRPRYVVERFWGRGLDVDMWVAERGFVILDNAKEYADEEQSRFPDSEFRVVDTQA